MASSSPGAHGPASPLPSPPGLPSPDSFAVSGTARAIDARSIVTLIIFFAVSEYRGDKA
jgi:hypothetical protein